MNPYESPKETEEVPPNLVDNLLVIFYYLNLFTLCLVFYPILLCIFLYIYIKNGWSWKSIFDFLLPLIYWIYCVGILGYLILSNFP